MAVPKPTEARCTDGIVQESYMKTTQVTPCLIPILQMLKLSQWIVLVVPAIPYQKWYKIVPSKHTTMCTVGGSSRVTCVVFV